MKNYFDKEQSNVVKGVAILLLLFHHLFLHKDFMDEVGLIYSDSLYYKLVPVINISRICVWMFVFISLYGLSRKYSLHKGSNFFFVLQQWLHLMWKWWITFGLMNMLYIIFRGNIFEHYNYSLLYFILDVFEWNDFFDYPRVFGSWYLCFAQVLILLIPIINIVCNKIGIIILPLSYLFMLHLGKGIVSTGGGDYTQYLLTAIAAVCLAQNSYKLLDERKNTCKRMMEFAGLFILAVILLSIQYELNVDERQISTILRMAAVCCLVLCIVKYFKGWLAKVLAFLGKHSAVMFMSNVFFYTEFRCVIFWSKNMFISYLTLVVITLLFAYLIDFICKKSGYNRLLECLIEKIEKAEKVWG